MKSSNSTITKGERVYALSEPGRQYLFYSAGRKFFNAKVQQGEYEVMLIDPITSRQEKKDNIKSK